MCENKSKIVVRLISRWLFRKRERSPEKDFLLPSSFHLIPREKPVSLPSCSHRPTKRQQRIKGKQTTECVCFLVLGHSPILQVFLKVVTACMPKPSLLPGNAALCWLQSGTAEPCLPLYQSSAPQSNFKLPVTLFTISSSPMIARTVRDPDSTWVSPASWTR